MNQRRASDALTPARRRWQLPFLASPACLRSVTWEDQRSQFVARYLLWLVGLAYFNFGGSVTLVPELLAAVNTVFGVHLLLNTTYLLHARRREFSPLRWRLAMWTDLVGAAFCAFADANVGSPAYLVFLAIILGNGMRYGLRPFAEAAVGGALLVTAVLVVRGTDYLSPMSVTGLFFLLFGVIVVLYSYSLLARIDRQRQPPGGREQRRHAHRPAQPPWPDGARRAPVRRGAQPPPVAGGAVRRSRRLQGHQRRARPSRRRHRAAQGRRADPRLDPRQRPGGALRRRRVRGGHARDQRVAGQARGRAPAGGGRPVGARRRAEPDPVDRHGRGAQPRPRSSTACCSASTAPCTCASSCTAAAGSAASTTCRPERAHAIA
ncbi:MAG: hypothetical protein MZV65_52725 [Chromatiales bacterium]|nr:hypothetical protein [Chromatiales bacterium]